MESGNYFNNYTYIMTTPDNNETCPVCFESYGLHEDGSFLCKDGVSNSGLEGYSCQHYLCIKCWNRMYEREIYNCPLCRENLKIWMITYIGHGEREQGDDDYDDEAAEDARERYQIERDQSEREQEYREELRREIRRERQQSRIGRRRH
jgi:hypothetical protein